MTTTTLADLAPARWETEELVSALELSENGFMKFDARGRCVVMNQCASAVLRRDPESWLGKTLAQVAPEAIGTPFERAFQRCRRDGGLVVVDKEYYPPHARWYQSRFLRTDRGAVIICFRDITAQVHLEEAQAELRLQAACREHFEGMLGHDLRNPLSTITFAAAALLHGGDLTRPQAKSMHRIAASAGRMARMIESLLDLTRTRGGGELPIGPGPTDLAVVCRQGVDDAELANPNRQVELILEGNLSGVWDRDRLAQVVSNLLGNALDYSPPETPVRITARDDGDSVTLEVHNEGPPIPEDKQKEIFMPFRRGEQEKVVSRPNGLGLGLFISTLVAEAHGGSIQVASSVDLGTTFIVSLPRVAKERAATTPQQES
jgi:signal transduction histidine kinase